MRSCPLRGSIPARAGETRPSSVSLGLGRVYPRTGGGNRSSSLLRNRGSGLSPHGRGKRIAVRRRHQRGGSIPARAGETNCSAAATSARGVYPRTGGGNLQKRQICTGAAGLSPHGRGKPMAKRTRKGAAGSIPARAGETPGLTPKRLSGWVYPRTGGGNRPQDVIRLCRQGLSPHGRGKLRLGSRRNGHPGSIPARAGETDVAFLLTIEP